MRANFLVETNNAHWSHILYCVDYVYYFATWEEEFLANTIKKMHLSLCIA